MSAAWIDVSVPIRTGMVHWPGDPAVLVERTQELARGDAANVSRLDLGAHTGTHMDAPRHLNFFDAQTLQATATRAGMQVERLFFNEYCRYFADGYIGTEQRIFDHLGGAQPAVRNSAARAWRLLLKTAWAPARIKYDCVGVVAVKPA